MKTLRGTPASAGVARGPWFRVEAVQTPTGRPIRPEEVDGELAKLEDAGAVAAAELEAIAERVEREGHPDEAAIFGGQALMATDPALMSLAGDAIRERHVDSVAAVLAAGGELADQLRSLDDAVLSARSADVLDVASRVARRAAGLADAPGAGLEVPGVVVAEDLAPSVTATLPRDRLLGFALETGSATAHAAILARAYGIPAVVGVAGLLESLEPGEIAVDGTAGEVFIAPDEATGREIEIRVERARRVEATAMAEAGLPAVTTDDVAVALLANIGTPDEAPHAVELGARGVGLFRTEFLFLERSEAPSEEEQAAAYRAVVEAFAPDPVTIRLLDVGGDKPIPYLPLAPEANPFLGVRALRLAETQPGVFLTQLRAAMRAASAGPVQVMAPMVADATDAETLLMLASRAREELMASGLPFDDVALGVMLEIPGAILVGDSYFPGLAFASLGTNDLLQYTLAVDRGNPALARYQDSLHPALLRLVAEAVERTSRAGIELSVCGEMGGDPVAALALVGLGIRKLSMASGSLAPVRRAIRSQSAEVLRAEALAALSERSAAAVRARFERLAGAAAS